MRQDAHAGPIIHRRPFITGAVLAAVGTIVAMIGMFISVLSTAAGARRWIRQLDQHPGAARTKLHQARAAGAAGAGAWRSSRASSFPIIPAG